MRFMLSLESFGASKVLPINYQYELSSWIYKTIHFGDPKFAAWLHNHGYMDGKKQFRLFTFSKLYLEKYKIDGDRLELQSDKAILHISFYTNETVEPFIIGLFQNQEFSIGDKISQVHFRVNCVEKLAEPGWTSTMSFQAATPIVIGKKETETAKNVTYLSPEDQRYGSILIKNLLSKYIALMNKQRNESHQINLPNTSAVKFSLNSKPASKMIKIKAGTPEETFVKGYLFEFTITAPVELLKMGYHAGFGEKNSLGFGFGEVVK